MSEIGFQVNWGVDSRHFIPYAFFHFYTLCLYPIKNGRKQKLWNPRQIDHAGGMTPILCIPSVKILCIPSVQKREGVRKIVMESLKSGC